MSTGKLTVAELKVDIAFDYQAILDLEIEGEKDQHGKLLVKLELPEETETGRVISTKGSPISVIQPDGSCIFYGRCAELSVAVQGGYKTVQITAYTLSKDMDQQPMDRTFQDPAKALSQILEEVMGGYGASLLLDQDVAVAQVVSQKQETDWAFIVRLAGQFQKSVFVDIAAGGIHIGVGTQGFRFFEDGAAVPAGRIQRNVAAFCQKLYNGEDSAAFLFDREQLESDNLRISAGDRAAGDFITGHSIKSSGNLLSSYASGSRPAAVQPAYATQNQQALIQTVLTGTVMAVSGNQIQVAFDAPGGGSEMTWIPYEAAISNSFYCMPDEGDQVFIYYENNGKIICLGSKITDLSHPEYANPKEKSMTNHDKMIEMKEKSICLTATKELEREESDHRISILMDEEKGITIHSGREIRIESDQKLKLFVNSGPGNEEDLETSKETFEKMEEQGYQEYTSAGGTALDAALLGMKQDAMAAWGNISGAVQGMVFWDIWGGLVTNRDQDTPSDADGETVFEEGVLTLYGVFSLKFQVGESIIEMGSDIVIDTPHFSWMGYTQNSHEMVVEELKDWWETALDGLQLALDIAGFIPGIGAFFDLANAAVSLARGDFAGAAMSALAAIPGLGDAAAAAKIGVKATMKAYKAVKIATKARRVLKTVQAIYAAANALASVYRNRGQFAHLWNEISNGTFSWSDLDDVNSVIAVLNSANSFANAAKAGYEAAKGVEFSLDRQMMDQELANRYATQSQCKDPIDAVSGSQTISHTDAMLEDLSGSFLLTRRYESIHTNPGGLLGSKWMLQIESRLRITDTEITVMMPDMHLEVFDVTVGGYINQRKGEGFLTLSASDNGYRLVNKRSRTTYCYNETGRLLEIKDRSGNGTRLSYDGGTLMQVTLANGQYFRFSYREDKVACISDMTGRETTYQYEGEFLTQVTYPNHGTITYEYTAEGYLHGITDQTGNLIVKNDYDHKGRVVRQELGEEEYIIFYDEQNRTNTFLTVSNDSKLVFHYNQQRLVTKTVYDDGSFEEVRYDDWENPIYRKDRNGGELYREYSESGLLLKETLPNGLVTEYAYDTEGRRINQSDNSGREIRYAYDCAGNLVTERRLLAPGTWQTRTYEWDAVGRLCKVIDAGGGETSYIYDQNFSEPTCCMGPEGETVSYRYDEVGRKMERRTEDGIRRYGYNRIGYQALETDEEGLTTRYHYDAKCNLTEVILPREYNQGIDSRPGTRYEYDAFRHVVRTINPAGDVRAVCYDAEDHLLKEIHPNAYDPETGDGEGIRHAYDADGRRTHSYYPDGGVRRMFYDGNGNLIKRVDPLEYQAAMDDGIGTCYAYDEVNRLVQITNKDGIVETRYQYDLTGNIIKEINARGYALGSTDAERPGTLYRYNHAGWMVECREPIEQSGTGEEARLRYRLTCYQYDQNGNRTQERHYLTAQTEESSRGAVRTIRYTYDKSNRLTKVEDGAGAVLCYTYDHRGRKVHETSRICTSCWKETAYEYDRAGKLRAVKEKTDATGGGPAFAVTRLDYDANGNVTKIVTPLGNEILRDYDGANRLICEEHRERHGGIHNRIGYTYDKAGNVLARTDRNGHSVRYEYDWSNRLIKTVDRTGGVSLTGYDKNGRMVRRVKPNDYQQAGALAAGYQYRYDAQDRPVKVIGPDGSVLQTMTYTAWGALSEQRDGGGGGVQFTYDLAGRTTRVVTAEGATQQYAYNAVGNITDSWDGNHNHTRFLLDHWGRITEIQTADGSRECYQYDTAGNVIQATDGNGMSVRYEFNARNQLAKRVDGNGQEEQFCYDLEGRLCEYRNRNGAVERYHYNMYGAPTRHESGDGVLSEHWGYTPDGLLQYALGGGMRYDYRYDAQGRLKEKKASGRTLLYYEYDANGNKQFQRDVTGKTTEYRYNALDLLEEIYDNGKRQVRYEYHPDGTVKRMTAGRDLVTDYGFDRDQNLIDLKTTFGGEVLADYQYAFDGNGNQVSKRGLGGQTTYHYDSRNRLTEVVYPEAREQFGYDAAGNRTRRTTDQRDEWYHYDECNRLRERVTQIDGMPQVKASYEYDRQGNLLRDDRAVYHYDGFNRTERVETLDGQCQNNRYDAEGLRHEMEENGRLVQFLFSGREVVAETEADGTVIRYIRGNTLISSDSEQARTYYHYACDEMGSITHVVAEDSREVLNEYRYDAFGVTVYEREQVANRFRYAGQQYDRVTSQYYLRARFYNPVIGRFTQEDQYTGDGLNLYTYCQNHPVGRYDPSGYSACDLDIYKALQEQGILDPTKPAAEIKRLMDEQGMSFEDAYKAATGKKYDGTGENAKLYRQMSEAEAADTINKNALQPAKKGSEPTKWITESKDKAFQFDNAKNADVKTVVVEFEVESGYHQSLNDTSVPQHGSKNNPNNKYHYEGLPESGSDKNFGILDANIEEFNANVISTKIIDAD